MYDQIGANGQQIQCSLQNVPLTVFTNWGKNDRDQYITSNMLEPVALNDNLYSVNADWTKTEVWNRQECALKRCKFNLGPQALYCMRNERVDIRTLLSVHDGYLDMHSLLPGESMTITHNFDKEAWKPFGTWMGKI